MKLLKTPISFAITICLAVAFYGQSKTARQQNPLAAEAKAISILGTWQGTLPCADCSGIITTLTLYQKSQGSQDGIYRLRLKYIDRGSFTDYGHWATLHGTADNPDAFIYQINSDKPDSAQYYLRVDGSTLQQLDREKKPIQSSMNFSLKLISKSQNIEGMPNPASVNCTKHGGTLKIETGKDGGQIGICIFPNGKQCEEWAFFRHECTSDSGK